MPHCSAAGLDFRIIPAGFNAPLEFLTGFTSRSGDLMEVALSDGAKFIRKHSSDLNTFLLISLGRVYLNVA